MKNLVLTAMIALGPCAWGHAASAARYRLAGQFKLGGEGGWDYMTYDAGGRRLFIAHGARVSVVDPTNGTLIAEIPADGVHGVALAPDLGRGFISNGKGDSVTVFDLKTLKPLSEIKVSGTNPDCILYEPATKTVLAFNGRSKNVSLIDAEKGAETGVLALPGKPEFAAADGKGTAFVNIEDKSELAVIDVAKSSVTALWPLTGCEEPSGLSIDRQGRRLFAGCHNKTMAVVDADTGKVVSTLPIGQGVDATAFDPRAGLAFSSNGDGTLTVIREDSPEKFSVLQDAKTQKGARTMAVDDATGQVFLVTADMKEAPSAKGERPKRAPIPGTFRLLVMSAD